MHGSSRVQLMKRGLAGGLLLMVTLACAIGGRPSTPTLESTDPTVPTADGATAPADN